MYIGLGHGFSRYTSHPESMTPILGQEIDSLFVELGVQVEGFGDDALALVGHIPKLVHAQLQVPHVRRDLAAEDRLLFADVC